MARPEKIKTPLGQRLSDVRKKLGYAERPQFAELLGLPRDTLGNYERGDREPDLKLLGEYRDRFSVNMNWLVTGEGEMFEAISGKINSIAPVDTNLIEKMAKLARAVHEEMGFRLPGERVTAVAAELYNELLTLVSDITNTEEVEAFIPQLRYRLKKRINDAEAQLGTGKRLA